MDVKVLDNIIVIGRDCSIARIGSPLQGESLRVRVPEVETSGYSRRTALRFGGSGAGLNAAR